LHRDWKDQNWTSVANVNNGLDEATIEQRKILFGKNEIDIEARPTLSLLVDEVREVYF